MKTYQIDYQYDDFNNNGALMLNGCIMSATLGSLVECTPFGTVKQIIEINKTTEIEDITYCNGKFYFAVLTIQPNKRHKVDIYVGDPNKDYQNSINTARLATVEEINNHNTDNTAHDNRFNAIIQHVNNMLTTVDNTEGQPKAPTLALVKTLLSNLKIKDADDVIKALGDETLQKLGVRYDLSNQNAWYISFGKLFGGLIIQGGKQSVDYSDNVPVGKEYKYRLPIAYKSKCMVALGSTETNLANGWTYIDINYAPDKSSLSELTFHCWTNWDWSYKGFRLSVISIGF